MSTRRERVFEGVAPNGRQKTPASIVALIDDTINAYEVELAADLQSDQTVERVAEAIWELSGDSGDDWATEKARAALKAAVNDE